MKLSLLPLALALAAFAARAEDAAPAANAAQATAIPVGQIVPEAEALGRWARDVESDLGEGVQGRVAELLTETGAEIARRRAELEQLPTGAPARRALTAARARWEELAAELVEAQDELEHTTERLGQRLQEAAQRGARWSRTAAEAHEAGVPSALMEDVRGALKQLDQLRNRIESSRNALLELQQRASAQQRSVDAAIQRVTAMRAALRQKLVERDEPPLWRLHPVADGRADLRRAGEVLAGMGRDIADYAERSRDRLLVQLVLIVFLIWASVRGRPILRRACGDDAASAPGRGDVLAHPVAAGLLLGLAPTRALHPDAPYGFTELVAVIGLGPWLRVLRGALPAQLLRPLRWLGALVLLDFARELVATAPLLARLSLLLELGLGGLVAFRLRRAQPMVLLAPVAGRALRRGLDLWLRLALLAFAVGIAAAVFGYGDLARLLASTPVLGSFMGTVLLVVVLALELLLRAVVVAGVFDRVHLIRTQHAGLLRGASWLLRVAGAGAWLYIVLDYTGLGDVLWPRIGRLLAVPIGYGAVSLTLGGVLAFALAIWGSWLLSRFAAFVLDVEVFPRVRMPPGIPFAVAAFTRYAVLFVGFVIALGMIGFSLDRVTILLGALGVGVGFGLQNVINNFVSGVILLFERPIRVGDRIQLDDIVGDVTRIGMRASRVRTLDGIDLIVPNADFISARVTNWTLADRARRVSLDVGVAYGTRPERALELLERVARSHPEVLESPEPEVLFLGFGDSSLDFELRVWTDSRLFFRVRSDLAVATYAALEEAGIQIPFPQRDLHLRTVSREAGGVLARGATGGEDET